MADVGHRQSASQRANSGVSGLRWLKIECDDVESMVELRLEREHSMDMSWVTDRIAVGGGIWVAENMEKVKDAGITHVIDMQIEFDDTNLAKPFGIKVLWNPIDDDFQPKPPSVFRRGVEFGLDALKEPDSKVYVHCAAGVHRAPMMALALLRALGNDLETSKEMIQSSRYVADFADVYVRSVESFMEGYEEKSDAGR
jgi:protein tyrosine phosphatase (PTP) superfamily phosphohydrolase (DUF442 family)